MQQIDRVVEVVEETLKGEAVLFKDLLHDKLHVQCVEVYMYAYFAWLYYI